MNCVVLACVALLCACDGTNPATGSDASAGDANLGSASDAGDEGDVDATLAGLGCDPVSQLGCSDRALPKCTLVSTGGCCGFVRRCVPSTGVLAEGQVCLRDAHGPGYDDCEGGLYCTSLGQGTTDRRCRRVCHDDSGCHHDQRCVVFDSLTQLPDGLCIPTCLPLMGATACAHSGETCSQPLVDLDPSRFAIVCRAVGDGLEGAACSSGAQCGEGLACLAPAAGQGSSCTALCDGNHPCTSSSTRVTRWRARRSASAPDNEVCRPLD